MGTRVITSQTWDDVVLTDDIRAEVQEIIARVKHRRHVYESWGFARKLGRGLGLSALFYGAPGTGKTMVAGLIACELGLDLYQVDLSRIVSKWVGETEKQLANLFSAAETGHAILLFDEADSLFSKRTDVKSANDRYANLEVNYLLQRMEAFAGITVLTTNHDSAIDEAFRRRLAFRIEFPKPDIDERERIWRAVVPAEASVSKDVDFSDLARRYEMTGGYIRNAALRAAFFAASDNASINAEHLRRAAALEMSSMGKVVSRAHS
jgi:SpoVK/Ycf46/Vps4 family AAA+-type ATPase